MRRDLAWFTAVALIALPAAAVAQQTQWPDPPRAQPSQPTQWPDPPAARQPSPQPGQAAKPAKKPRKKPPAQQAEPDPRFEEEPLPGSPATAQRPKPASRAAAALNIQCDGPFARDSGHDRLVKAFGARNVVAQGSPAGGSTIVFPNDPKRRLEVTWRDAAARNRPAAIIVEAQSAWRARGFRLGDALAQVENVNGKPFKLAGFDGEGGGAARDWQGGKLDKLSGGCLLGMRFAPTPAAPADARAKTASGELTSNSPEVRAAKPMIIEMIVGYPE